MISIHFWTDERATGTKLIITRWSEAPDAICRRPDGTEVGVEFTQARRSPQDAKWDAMLDIKKKWIRSMRLRRSSASFCKKARLRANYQTDRDFGRRRV